MINAGRTPNWSGTISRMERRVALGELRVRMKTPQIERGSTFQMLFAEYLRAQAVRSPVRAVRKWITSALRQPIMSSGQVIALLGIARRA
jgi:hypothetical protein